MGEEGWEVPSMDPARLGVRRATFDGYSQGAGGSSLQTKGVSAVKLCLERRQKDEKPQSCEQNTVDLSGCFFFFNPCKVNTDGRTLQGGSGCGGAEPAPGPYLHIPVQTPCLLYSHVMSVLSPVGCCISQISCCFVLLFLIISSVTPG